MSAPVRSDPPVDPRGVRFAALLTTVVLTVVLVTGSGQLLAVQALVFALGAFAGLRFAPYPVAYRALVAPRLRPSTEREEAAPVRFSQLVGLVLAVLGTLGYLTGRTVLGVVATAFALAVAFLNAAFGFCLGCELSAVIGPSRDRHRRNEQGATA